MDIIDFSKDKNVLITLTQKQLEEINNILNYRLANPSGIKPDLHLKKIVEALIKLGLEYYREIEPNYLKFLAEKIARENIPT